MEVIFETDEQVKLKKKGMGSKHHSLIQYNLILSLGVQYQAIYKFIPELSLDLDGQEKVPDLCIYKTEEITYGKEEIRMKNLPLGVIEILSPKQSVNDLVEKSNIYFEIGIPSYWLVLPSLRSVYVYTSQNDYKVYTYKEILMDSILNIELELSKIF